MPEVLPPDIHHPDPALGGTQPNGVQNLVINLEAELFDDLPYIRASGWRGNGALVLSLWTKEGLVTPLQPVRVPGIAPAPTSNPCLNLKP